MSETDENIKLVHNPLLGFPRNAPCPCGDGKKWKKCHGPVMPRQIPETQLKSHQQWLAEGKAWASRR